VAALASRPISSLALSSRASVSRLARDRALRLPSSRHSRPRLRSDSFRVSRCYDGAIVDSSPRPCFARRCDRDGNKRRWWRGRGDGTGLVEYPCLCAKTVALAVKCGYVGHANEGRCVLRCCPKCVEPSAPRRCASSLLERLGEAYLRFSVIVDEEISRTEARCQRAMQQPTGILSKRYLYSA